jgi:hypothetical protein
MSEQFPICGVRLPSFGRARVIQVRSWSSLKSRTCRKRAGGASSPRVTLRPLPTNSQLPERSRHGACWVADDHGAQHLDTLLVWGEEPETGSHLVSPRRGYMHHGIYVGEGRVVHYAGLARGRFRGRIEEVSLAKFADGRSVWTRNSHLPAFVPQEVIRRARARVGENRYRVFRNNCEHFCEWCLRGEPRSYQVERFLASRPVLGLMFGLRSLASGSRSRTTSLHAI